MKKTSIARKLTAAALSVVVAASICGVAPAAFADEAAAPDQPTTDTPAAKVNLKDAKVTLSATSLAYNGKVQAPTATVTVNDVTLVEGVDYKVTTQKRKTLGTGKVTVTGIGNYTGTKTAYYKIVKAKTKLRIIAKNKKIKAKTLAKKSVNVSKVVVKGNHGAVRFTKASGDDCLSVSKTSGKIKIAKKTAPGTYQITVHVAAKSTTNYKSATKDIEVTIVVK